MSYQVLARKWRPQTFQQVVGQEHVLKALMHALDTQRLHHAYLFTGTRGVGKTSLARILTKCLNCEQGVSANPCRECGTCKEIEQGRCVDLIEVDAASRTKVEDTRDLLDNTQYAPTRARFKIYLIDEVHMLSGHSFNALLKTLEEPPEHIKFLLATTDPQKLPITVLSRCLQFNLKNMLPEQIADHLKTILAEEKIEAESPALLQLAIAANGSIRDGLSLLDQAISHGDGAIKEGDVRELLGTVERSHITALLTHLAKQNAQQLFDRIKHIALQGADFNQVLEELLSTLHKIAVMQTLKGNGIEDDPTSHDLQPLAEQIAPEDIQLYYQIALLARRDLPLAPSPQAGFEMTVLRMLNFTPASPTKIKAQVPKGTQQQVTKGTQQKVPENTQQKVTESTQQKVPENTQQQVTKGTHQQVPESAQQQVPKSTQQQVPENTQQQVPEVPQATQQTSQNQTINWEETVPKLNLSGMTHTLATHCILNEKQNNQIKLRLDPAYEPLNNNAQKLRLENALSLHFNETIRLNITLGDTQEQSPAAKNQQQASKELRAAQEVIEKDPNIQAIIDNFDAIIVPDSIQPSTKATTNEE